MRKHCQSCGMPLEQDPGKWGTEKDGTLSMKYCSYCYRDGAFTDPDCTLEKMMGIVEKMTLDMWLPESHRKIAIAAVPKLERWR